MPSSTSSSGAAGRVEFLDRVTLLFGDRDNAVRSFAIGSLAEGVFAHAHQRWAIIA